MLDLYWYHGALYVRHFVTYTLLSNLYFGVISVRRTFFSEDSTQGQMVMQTIYWVCLIFTSIFVYLSHKFEEKINYKIWAFAITSFRNLLRLFDFERSRDRSKTGATFDYNFESDSEGELRVFTTDYVMTMIMQSTFCFILCTIGKMHF